MDAFLLSTLVVALAEIGDKTQLLAIVLATRFARARLSIVAGIAVATLANHFLAAWAGAAVGRWLEGDWFQIGVGVSFLAMAGWTLIPDELDEDGEAKPARFGPFLATTVAFFLVEIGDKTQIATVALGARFHDAVTVTLGTTLGMMLANVPAVYLGGALVKAVPLSVVRKVAAGLFAAIGAWVLVTAFAG
jgi:putative Ca2+/H+ antiporter (TMEM165/GDT1 family)